MDLGQALGVIVFMLVGFGAGWAWRWQRDKASRRAVEPRHTAQLVELRAIGELSVFKAVSKDILTHIDHTFGEFGRKYLSWAFSRKRLAMIFEFEMDFRYDLRDPRCTVSAELSTEGRPARAVVLLPPCKVDVSIRDLLFYDEQRARFLPWLLPDLLQGFFQGGFSEEDKNKLIASAKAHAMAEANVLAVRYRAQVEGSAYRTLKTISQSLGFPELEVRFAQESEITETIGLSEAVSPTAPAERVVPPAIVDGVVDPAAFGGPVGAGRAAAVPEPSAPAAMRPGAPRSGAAEGDRGAVR